MPKDDAVDFFTDMSIINDPCPYFENLRSEGPVARDPHGRGLWVTGYDEAAELFNKQGEAFSSRAAIMGPLTPMPFEPKGDDISGEIAEHGGEFPWATHFITFDPPEHTAHRTILTRLLTHQRLKKNEEYMQGLADRLIDGFIDRGKCEIVADYAQSMATLVIADLLGVPEEDRDELVERIGPPPGMIEDPEHKSAPDPLEYLDMRFTEYLKERRTNPCDDMMSELANARFRDGSVPDLDGLVRIATFLFVAGQDTSVKMVTSAFRVLGECPHIQARLRSEPERIPDFVEETLRFHSPTKVNFRLAKKNTKIDGVDVPAGTMVACSLTAVNRDPEHFENPNEFDIDRPHLRDHMAFGRGFHACPGAPLARFEGRITLERFLARMGNIRISEAEHGPPDARRYEFVPTFLLNGLTHLHIEFDKA